MRKSLWVIASVAVVVLVAIVGLIADATATAGLLFSDGFEEWLSERSVIVFWSAVTAIIILVVALALARKSISSKQAEISELASSKASVERSLLKAKRALAET